MDRSNIRFFLHFVIVFLLFNFRVSCSYDLCTSLQVLSNKTNGLIMEGLTFSCINAKECISVDCYMYQSQEKSIKFFKYGVSFEHVCNQNSTFLFYWENSRVSMQFNKPSHAINISELTSNGMKVGKEISIRTNLLESKSDHFNVSLQILLRLNEGQTIDLIPPHNITFLICNKIKFMRSATYELSTPFDPLSRTPTGRECNPHDMGSCHNNEVCMSDNDTFSQCYCFDAYVLDSTGTCVPSPSSPPFNRNILWGVLGSILVAFLIGGLFIVVWKCYPRTRRFNEFNLNSQDATSPDPPMLEA